MNDRSSLPDADEEILAEFVGDFERQGEAVLPVWKGRYPHLASQIDEVVRFQDAIGNTRHDGEPSVPERLGDFRMIRCIARGGMGEVWEAEQERLHKRRIAVKIIRRGRISVEARKRFLVEQEMLAKLHQTDIVPIFVAGDEGRLQYFAMPFIDGAALNHVVHAARQQETDSPGSKTPTLAELAALVASDAGQKPRPQSADVDGGSTGSVSPAGSARPNPTKQVQLSLVYFRSVAQVMSDVADAVKHAHDAGIVHRDLKPSNIMVERPAKDGSASKCWIIDFGLAKYVDQNAGATLTETANGNSALTQGPVGTPSYMSPEQFAGEAGPQVDVWGLGTTLYELLTLRRCFDGTTVAEVRAKVEAGELPPPPSGVPPDLLAIARKALAKKPEQRYATAGEFGADLRRWLNYEPTRARPAWPLRRAGMWARRNKGWAVAGLFAVVATLVVTWVVVRAEERRIIYANDLASKEGERATAAETGERKRDREALRSDLLRTLMTARVAGWREEAAGQVRRMVAKAEPRDAELRDLAAATLIGLDAKRLPEFKFAATSVAFDRDGKRLFMYEPGKGVHISDDSVNAPKLVEQPGSGGPFVFRKDGTALQLVIPKDDPSTLVLWDVLGQKLVQRFRFPGRKQFAHACAAASDSDLVVGAAHRADREGCTVAVWEGTTGKLVYAMAAPATVTDVALAPDGSLLAVGDPEGRITVRTLPNGEPIDLPRSGNNKITTLAFGRDPLRRVTPAGPGAGWLLAAGDMGSRITVWDVAMRVPRCYCFGSENGIHAMAFSPDGTTLATTGREVVKLWDIATGRLVLDLEANQWMTDVAFSPDGTRLAASSLPIFGHAAVSLWELHDGHGLRSFRGLVGAVTKLSLSPDGRLVAALADDWHVALWERSTGRLRFVFETPKGFVSDNAALAFNADGSRLAFASGSAAVLWDAAKGQIVQQWDLPPGYSDQLAFHPTGKLILARVECQDGKTIPFSPNDPKVHPRVLRFRDLFGEKPREAFKEITDFKWHVFHSVMALDGSLLVVEGAAGPGFEGRAMNAYDGMTGAQLWSRTITSKRDGARPRLDPKGQLLAFETSERTMIVIDARTEKHVAALPRIYSEFGPGATLRATCNDHPPFGVSLFRRDDLAPLVTLGLNVNVGDLSLKFDADGRHVVWGNRDGTVTLADLDEVNRRLAEFKLEW